ncbi:MAG: hypothetical protein INR71_05135 [Terriglobus roseus]|nr:hypothetical protein [Terriglobus roseus]
MAEFSNGHSAGRTTCAPRRSRSWTGMCRAQSMANGKPIYRFQLGRGADGTYTAELVND